MLNIVGAAAVMILASTGPRAGAVPPAPPGPPPDDAALAARIAALEREIARLDASASPIDERRAREIRALVADVLADADTRAAFLSGPAPGPSRAFVIGSGDGPFQLKINAIVQVRAVYNRLDGASPGVDSDRYGFENRRTRLRFTGHVIDPGWTFYVMGSFDRDSPTFELSRAYITRDLGQGMHLRVGQMKAALLHEELISTTRQLAVERSLVNGEFTGSTVQGLELGYESDAWRLAGQYGDGFFAGGTGTENTSWDERDTEYAFTARVEWNSLGNFKRFDDFSSAPGEEPGVLIGAAAHWQRDEFGTADEDESELLCATADVSLELGGWNLAAAAVYRRLDSDLSAALDQWGAFVQGGTFIAENLELFARYEAGDLDVEDVSELGVVTVGLAKYISGHDLKWTTDLGYGLEPVDAAWASSGAGWRADADGADGQIVVRSQMQLAF